MMKAEPIGLYVHIPFCVKKCNYCDFCSFPDIDSSSRAVYIDAMIREMERYKNEEKIAVDSIFFGGGTPSLLEPEEFIKIHSAILNIFDISDDCEFTVEVNPKTLTGEKLSAYVSCGVNRISIGLQTIHENERKILGRIHNFEDFKKAYRMVRDSGISNISVDVMYGIPEQTVQSFEETLKTVISFSPTHISAYGLILEEGTPFWETRNNLALPGEDDECEMYELACRLLGDCGYSHYEISNYAASGYESRHNLKYWKNKSYIGIGIAAYSCYGGKRYGNFSGMSEYLSENSAQYVVEEEHDATASAYEFVMLGLRLKSGISLSEYKTLFSRDFLDGREEKINSFVNGGFMMCDGDRIALTEKGFYVSNSILTDLL